MTIISYCASPLLCARNYSKERLSHVHYLHQFYKKMRRLPDTELEVMLVLWEAEGEVPRSYFDRQLKDKHWNINTINTYFPTGGKGVSHL